MADDDHKSAPGTEPFVPDFDDTGEHSVPFVPDFDSDSQPVLALAGLKMKTEADRARQSKEKPESPSPTPTASGVTAVAPAAEAAATPVAVPGRYQYVKWWKLLLVLLGVWIGAAEVGLNLFYWWYHTIDKTAVVFVVLVCTVACMVGGLMLSMVQGRPLIAALSLALMSGPFASVAAAAPLYGYFYCERVSRCLLGVVPY